MSADAELDRILAPLRAVEAAANAEWARKQELAARRAVTDDLVNVRPSTRGPHIDALVGVGYDRAEAGRMVDRKLCELSQAAVQRWTDRLIVRPAVAGFVVISFAPLVLWLVAMVCGILRP